MWKPANDEQWQASCAILTRDAAGPAAEVHERMPVVLSKDAEAGWLDPKITDAEQAMAIAREHGVTEIEYHQVTSRVNLAANDDKALIEALGDKKEKSRYCVLCACKKQDTYTAPAPRELPFLRFPFAPFALTLFMPAVGRPFLTLEKSAGSRGLHALTDAGHACFSFSWKSDPARMGDGVSDDQSDACRRDEPLRGSFCFPQGLRVVGGDAFQ